MGQRRRPLGWLLTLATVGVAGLSGGEGGMLPHLMFWIYNCVFDINLRLLRYECIFLSWVFILQYEPWSSPAALQWYVLLALPSPFSLCVLAFEFPMPVSLSSEVL